MASEPETKIVFDLFPGCVIQNRIPFIEKSARFVFEKLGVQLEDVPDYGCCPDPVGVQSTDHQTWLTLGARNLSLSEKTGNPIVSLCNGCTETLRGVKYELEKHPHERELVVERLKKVGKTYEGTSEVKHFLEVLHDDIGLDKIKALVVKPLTDLKVAVHVGCHYSRPSEMMQTADDAMNPYYPDDILRAIGATPTPYQESQMCCGSGTARHNPDAANGMLKRKFESILEETEAKVLAVNCPSCYQQLEVGQRALRKAYGMDVKMPVLYITELMALAFGMPIADMGLKFHQIKPLKLLKSLGFE
ncbi:MAG: CoB--CoM heterodisulfide reductase iron-sulfur subunit B family protein [Promethearchaeota archaeon]